MHDPDETIKQQARRRFGATAEDYVNSQVHATGDDLARLLALASPQPDWRVLDIATGGGHTAAHFAPHVRQVVAADLTLPMLLAARSAYPLPNIQYMACDAESMAFPDACFDLVTCRIAPHHFPDCFAFVNECRRVVRPGGVVIIEDHVAPDDVTAARYINAFERLRDPSHVRSYATYEWRGMFLDAGLQVLSTETLTRSAGGFHDWVNRQRRPAEVREKLMVMLTQAPEVVADFLQPRNLTASDADFDHQYIIIKGIKPA